MANKDFDKKLLESENPFPYPEPPRRPSFVIGGGPYLKWFKNEYRNRTKSEGTSGVFVVGMPGSGKTHILRHLDYLFYEKCELEGIYGIKILSDQEIDEREIWKSLFLTKDSANRLTSLVPLKKINDAEIRPDIKENIMKLVDQSLNMDLLSIEAIRNVVWNISELLPKESMICLALDNIEEYLSAREDEYQVRAKIIPEEVNAKQRATAEAVRLLVEKIRNMTSGLRRSMVLLALTTPAWVEVRNTDPSRTKGRRFKFAEEQVIADFTLSQCLQLVHEYMKQWSANKGITIPIEEECVCTIGNKSKSIYPFTPLAIELAKDLTQGLAGDITCFCSECINSMRNNGQIEKVKDKFTFDIIKRVSKEYGWLGWAEKATELLEDMGPIILEKHLTSKLSVLEKHMREKYKPGIESETVTSSIDRFANIVGVVVSSSPSVENSYNPSAKHVHPSPLLKIWSFAETKIAVKYVIGNEQNHIPEIHMYGGKTSFQDYVDILSLIDAGKATHGLLILLWAVEDQMKLGQGLQRTLKEFGDTIKTMSITTNDLNKILAVTEATDEQKDLAIFLDRMIINLTSRLSFLKQQQRPVEEHKVEKYTRHY